MADEEDKKKAKEDKKAEKLAKKEAKKAEKLAKKEAKKADSKEAEKPDDAANGNEAQKTDKEASSAGILQWIIMAVVVIVCAGAGFGLGRLSAGPGEPQLTEMTTQQAKPAVTTTPQKPTAKAPPENSKATWFYEDLEPVAANLNVPNATRYVRATLTLEISSDMEEGQGRELLDTKKAVLKNQLYLFLSSLSIEDCTGPRNLMRIRSEILDAFNKALFPDGKPQITKIYLKEFIVQ